MFLSPSLFKILVQDMLALLDHCFSIRMSGMSTKRRSQQTVKKYNMIRCSCRLKQWRVKKTRDNRSINKRISNTPSTSAEQHTKEYPCPQCDQSLASRFRYHTVPKLKLRDTVWIPTNNNKSFFIICYTELGPQSDGILDELRRAEIGIRAGTKVFVISLSCALGIQKVVEKQKTLPSVPLAGNDNEEQDGREGRINLSERPSVSPVNIPAHPFVKSIPSTFDCS